VLLPVVLRQAFNIGVEGRILTRKLRICKVRSGLRDPPDRFPDKVSDIKLFNKRRCWFLLSGRQTFGGGNGHVSLLLKMLLDVFMAGFELWLNRGVLLVLLLLEVLGLHGNSVGLDSRAFRHFSN
jgi:hypothetical protein